MAGGNPDGVISVQNPNSVDLLALQTAMVEAKATLVSTTATEDEKAAATESIQQHFSEQQSQFHSSERLNLRQHPSLSFLEERLSSDDPAIQADAVLLMGYVNSLPLAEAQNSHFPGYDLEANGFSNVDNLPDVQAVLHGAYSEAVQGALKAAVNPDRAALPSLFEMSVPEGVTPDEGITLARITEDLKAFKDEDGVNAIGEMYRQLNEDGTINPYRMAVMQLSCAVAAGEMKDYVESFIPDFLKKGEPSPAFDRDAFIQKTVEENYSGLALVDQDIPVADLAKANGLEDGQVVGLRADLASDLSIGVMITEARDISDDAGFPAWMLGTIVKEGITTEEKAEALLEDPQRLGEILKTFDSVSPERGENLESHLRVVKSHFEDRAAAEEAGLTLGDYRMLQNEGEAAFLARHVAQQRGAEIVPASYSDDESGLDLDYEAKADGFQLRIPVLEGGFDVEGERISTGFYSDSDGDGFRLGAVNVGLFDQAPIGELYFRHSFEGTGKLDLGLLGHVDGDTDGIIRTPRPWVGDHLQRHGEILGARFSGQDFSLGEGTLTPTLTAGYQVLDEDLFAHTGAVYNVGLTENSDLTSGLSYTYADGMSRFDGHGQVSTDLTDCVSFGGPTLWHNGLHATQRLGDENQFLGTAYTELEMNTAGDHWYSNLRHVFGAYTQTDFDDLESYGVYTEQSLRVDLGKIQPDIGIRVGYDTEEEATVGVVCGFSF